MSSQIVQRLALAHTGKQFAQSLEELACELSGATAARFFAYDRDTQQLVAVRSDHPVALDETTLPGQCALFSEPCSDASKPIPTLTRADFASGLPVRNSGGLCGVLTATGPRELGCLAPLAEVAGVIYEGIVLKEDGAQLMLRTQELLIRAVELLPGVPPEHVLRVARLASELAALLDLDALTRSRIWQAACYHDLGKLILHDRSEWEIHKQHPQAGALYLASSRQLRHLAPLVEGHHERYDGTGFPHAREGDELPLEVWTLALAEHFEEHLQERRLGTSEAVQDFLARFAGAHHPEVVDALLGLCDSQRLMASL